VSKVAVLLVWLAGILFALLLPFVADVTVLDEDDKPVVLEAKIPFLILFALLWPVAAPALLLSGDLRRR
jgi:hypothetical protein